MAGQWLTVANLKKGGEGKPIVGGLSGEMILFKGLPKDAKCEVRKCEGRGENGPAVLAMIVNGAEAELGAMWRPRKEGSSSVFSGKVSGAASILLGIPAGSSLLLQKAREGDEGDYRLSICVEEAAKGEGNGDFDDDADAADPFA